MPARALWVTRWDYRSAAEVRTALERAAAHGFDTVFFQVRGNGTVFYPSALEPWAEEFEHRDPGFDPLAVAVESAGALGLALHAWVNAVPGWRGATPSRAAEQLYNRHPDWFLYTAEGVRQPLADRRYVALNVCLPEVRAHIVAICREIVARYPVAGLHLDYIRFIETAAGLDTPQDPATLAAYRAATGAVPDADPVAWQDWKRGQLSRLVAEIADAVRAERPTLCLSAAVYRTPRIAREEVLQDWPQWLQEGWLDLAVPMQYDTDDARFRRRVVECRAATPGQRLLMGIGVYRHSEPDQTRRQVAFARELGCDGFALFAYASFFESPADALDEDPPTPELRALRRQELLPVTNL